MDGSTGADFKRNHDEPTEARRKRIERQDRSETIRQLKASAKRYDDLACREKDADLRRHYSNVALRYINTAHAVEDLHNAINRLG